MRPPTVFHDTIHAGKRRAQRGLSAVEMQAAVINPERRAQHRRGEHGGFGYEFVRESEGETLTVIAEVKKTECWLITGWRS